MALAIVACILACLLIKSKENRNLEMWDVITGKPIDDEEAVASDHPRIKREFSWENEGLGKLVFYGGVGEMYSLEELLKASAETLGRGTMGSTYKVVMESGLFVMVMRLKDSGSLGVEEFWRRMEKIGWLRHPNLVLLRAYFQAKEETLMGASSL